MADRACAHCDGDMTARRRDATYCSRTCKTGASDRRRHADGRAQARDRARYSREAEHRRDYARQHGSALRSRAITHYAGKCAECGTTDHPELDHIAGNGERHRDIVGHGDAFFRYLIRESFPSECEPGGEYELQILCRPCHSGKTKRERLERG